MTDAPIVSLEGIKKWYGGVPVLKDVSLEFSRGAVHGLVGENGAGKSTLVRVMAGIVRMDRGAIAVDGTPILIRNPHDALRHGITMITQELSLVPQRSVLENIFLGQLDHRFGIVRSGATLRRYLALTDRVGFTELDPDQVVGTLTTAQQQQVEMLRALARDARLIVMDEPTAILGARDAAQLLNVIRRLKADGVTVVFISHFLEEVLSIADAVSVLRDGALITTGPATGYTSAGLVQHMVGRPVDVVYPEPAAVDRNSPVVLCATGLVRRPFVRGVDLDVRRGEIVGLAGLVGSGRSETARLIFGADKPDAGEVSVNGHPLHSGSPVAAMAAGVAMVPEDRKEQGLVLVRPVRENVSLASLGMWSTAGFVGPRRERQAVQDAARRTDVRGVTLESPMWSLSGGNQQKALFAKWLLRRPAILIADEPTRGVDVAAKVQIHRLLRDLAADGAAILLISSEIEEVMGLSNRTLVMRQGRVVATFARGDGTREQLLAAAFSEAVAEER